MNSKKRILIVDDEPLIRLGLKRLLNRSSEMEVIGEASNGCEAIEQVVAMQPDLVLMDVRMPIMDGVEAATRIKKDFPNVQVIMLSSVDTEQEVLGSIIAGASGYCLKESDPERLFTAIKAVQGGDLWLDATIASVILKSLKKGAQASLFPAPIKQYKSAADHTEKYVVMSADDLKLLGHIVEGHSHEKLAQVFDVSPTRLREMQDQMMNKISVIEATKLAHTFQQETYDRKSEQNMECPTCNNRFLDKIARCPYDGTRLLSHKPDPLIGTTFADRFEIQSLIGQGSGGAVYKARHKFMNRTLALKVMHVDLMADLSLVQRFRLEAEAASSLDHPNIVSVLDFGLSQEGYAYMVMDMLQGPSLADLLGKLGHMNIEAAVQIFAQCSNGLGHAHSKGLIHRDFKPSNVILIGDADGQVQAKIVDFGIAKIFRRSGADVPELTVQGEVFGTPTYMSPEQCAGFVLTPASDIYSWGVSLYQTLTGSAPFSASNMPELMYMHLKTEPVPLRNFSSFSISPELSDVVMKCLEKEPKNRFQTMREAKVALLSAINVPTL